MEGSARSTRGALEAARATAVLGVPDPVWGEVGVAVCIARPGTDTNAIDLREWLDGKVARYKLPKQVIFWEEMPKSAYGKITKKMVREELAKRGQIPGAETAKA